MSVRSTKADEFRRKARECTEIAQRMSHETERQQMLELARDWNALAERAERER